MIEQAEAWIMENGLILLSRLAVAAVILMVGKFAIDGIVKLLDRQLQKVQKISELLRSFFLGTANKLLWLIVLMMALSQLGVEVLPLLAGIGVAGFIIGFAFQDSLGNLAAGLMILLNDPYKNGDYVEAGGHGGTIREMNLMATTMTTPDNRKIIIPNSKIWGTPIINFTTMPTRRVEVKFGISYTSDIGKAKEVVLDVVKNHELTLEDPAPMVEMVEMADSSLNFVARGWVETANFWAAFFDLNKQIKEALDANGITIPFPQLDVHHHNTQEKAAG